MKKILQNKKWIKRIVITTCLSLLLVGGTQFLLAQNTHGPTEQEGSNAGTVQNSNGSPELAPEALLNPLNMYQWDPYEEIQAMRQQMDQIFNNFDNRLLMSPFFRNDRQPFSITPQTDIEETGEQYIITMNIPGADNSEIQVTLKDNLLTVNASTTQSYEETKDKNYIRIERSTGTIHRAVTLPGPVKNEGMLTTYEDGILTITIQKKQA